MMCLKDALFDYKQKVNSNTRLRGLLKGWEPCIHIFAMDTDIEYYLTVRDSFVEDIYDGDPGVQKHLIKLEATQNELEQIFSGNTNPANSFLEGNLAVYSDDKDQVKLDAISLVLWGL